KEKLEKEFSDEASEIEIRHIEKKCYASITFTKELEFEEPHPEVGSALNSIGGAQLMRVIEFMSQKGFRFNSINSSTFEHPSLFKKTHKTELSTRILFVEGKN
ncbi:MAG: hypothetical protein JSW40_04955, partial [Candidatus Omnitrophota bacterium]